MATSNPQHVLITGGVRRLGLHIAYAFAEQGATLGLNYFRSSRSEADRAREECLKRGASGVHLLPGDITIQAMDVTNAFATIVSRIDVVINNSGVMPARNSTEHLSVDQFSQTLGLNLVAPFAVTQAALPFMTRGGAVVNLASLGGIQTWNERIDYNTSKSALIALTKALARDLAPKRITVNAVAPGAIQVDRESPQRMGIAEEKIPMGTYGKPEDIAKAVLFFACNAPYVTGQTLVVDGGRSVVG
jgi:NAD(P)-dependent dehydrogenase (short-subunit alcohol dehydrogenase family)